MTQGRISVDVFMFVNTKSGGQRGQALMKVPQPFEVDLGHGRKAVLHVFDMLEDPPGDKPGFKKLKEATRSSVVRVVIAGGDGTILWAIEEAERHEIDTRKQVMIAVMPLGTGNDFSRFTGWGGKAPNMAVLLRGGAQGLRDLVRYYVAAKPMHHDIWRVDMTVDKERGSIIKTNKDRKKEETGETFESKLMHSYFSAGNDARAGMSQEKVRTRTRWGNLFNYGFQICLKGLPFRDKEYVKDFASSMHHGLDADGQLIFNTEEEKASSSSPQLVGNPQVLIVLNIPNCYGGLCRFWEGAGSLGVSPVSDSNLLSSQLDPADGKLEVLTYGSMLVEPAIDVVTSKLGAASRFNAKRIFSGSPIFLKFAEPWSDFFVHIQIDGEFLKLKNPSSVVFEQHRKIQVLHSGRDDVGLSVESETSDVEDSSESGSDSSRSSSPRRR